MNKRFSKLLSLLLAVVMMLSIVMVSACKNGSGDDNSKSNTSTSENSVSDNSSNGSGSPSEATSSSKASAYSDCVFDFSAAKTIYLVSEPFSSKGITAQATLLNGTKLKFVAGNLKFDTSVFKSDTAGEYTIKVSFDKFSQDLKVKVCVPEKVNFDDSAVTKKYSINQKFDATGFKAMAEVTGVDPLDVSSNVSIDSSAYKADVAGTYEIKVSYLTFEHKFNVEVCEPVSCKFDFSNAKKIYAKNQTFDKRNIIVTATLADNTEIVLDSSFITFDTATFNSAVAGRYSIKASYLTFNEIFDVNVAGSPTVVGDTITVKVDKNFDENLLATVDADGALLMNDLTSTIDVLKAAAYPDTTIKKVYIAAGDYNEKIEIPKILKNVKFIGATNGTTKITYGDYAGKKDANGQKIGTDKTATVSIYGDKFEATRIYFENSFDYFNPPAGVSDKQALAVYARADKLVFNECTFTGVQDTLETVEFRQYYYKCTIKGNVDFIFGNNPAALFEDCDIVTVDRKSDNGGYITAMKGNNIGNGKNTTDYGVVFLHSRFTAEAGVKEHSVALGRPWRADATVAFISCEMGKHIALVPYGTSGVKGTRYTAMNGGGLDNLPSGAKFAEYGNTGEGAVNVDSDDFTLLTKEQADKYTLANIFAKTNGMVTYADEWDAAAALTALKAL